MPSKTTDTTTLSDLVAPAWLFWTLIGAGIYNLVWGAIAIFLPIHSFTALGAAAPRYPELWQCIGMIVGVYGVGYLIAATDPFRHWPILLVGLMGKVLGPLGFVKALWEGALPPSFGIHILLNDLIWWYPFGYALWSGYQLKRPRTLPWNESRLVKTPLPDGRMVADMDCPILMVALRHHGCIFTQETLQQLAECWPRLKAKGWHLVIVHMDSTGELQNKLTQCFNNDTGWTAVYDPAQQIYQHLGARRGTLTRLFGCSEWRRGLRLVLQGYRVGPLRGDGTQLAGVALIDGHRVVERFLPSRASTRLPLEDWLASLECRPSSRSGAGA